MQWMNSNSRKASSGLKGQGTSVESITKISETLELVASSISSSNALTADKGAEAVDAAATGFAVQVQSAPAGYVYVHVSEWLCPRDAVPLLRSRLHGATRGLAVLTY
jgi:hypothetical protein